MIGSVIDILGWGIVDYLCNRVIRVEFDLGRSGKVCVEESHPPITDRGWLLVKGERSKCLLNY